MRNATALLLAATLVAAPLAAQAGRGNDALIGTIIGGTTGAVIGNGFGGRDGAIVGGVIGAAAGVAIATNNDRNDNNRYEDHGRYDNRNDGRGYHDDYNRGYNRYDRGGRREVVVVESPRHYYRGNEFVYGSPSRYDRGYERSRYNDRGPDVVIIQQQSPRYSRYDNNYCPPPRRW